MSLRSCLFVSGIVILAGLTSLNPLRADVIYTNFGDGDSYAAGAGLIVTNDGRAWSSVAVAFTPAANYTLSSIELVATGLYPGSADYATVSIFADNGGQPDTTPLESFTMGPLEQFGSLVPVTSFTSVSQPLLLADTPYWVGMNAPAGDFIIWNQNVTFAQGFSQTDGSGNWSSAFWDQGVVQIDGTPAQTDIGFGISPSFDAVSNVPEPSSWGLLAAGLTALASAVAIRRSSV